MSAFLRQFCAQILRRPTLGPARLALAAVLTLTLGTIAHAQRIIFPSTIDSGAATQPIYTTQQPGAVLNAQPAAPAWDPFATGPAATTAPTLTTTPEPYVAQPYSDGFVPQAIRLIQDMRATNAWLARTGGANGFGTNDLDLSLSFGIPTRFNPAPILITPGFDFHFWNGPDSAPGVTQDLPARVYDAYLASSWQPQITPRIGADLAFAIGVFSDFQYVNSQSIRILGRGIGTYAFNERWKLAFGIMYLDRLKVKLLPAGGLIWTPNADTRYEILFPNPKLSHRITNLRNTELWGYVAGEYGGGMWTVEHVNGLKERVGYNDLRLILGVETIGYQRMRGLFEVGYIFDRQIQYGSQNLTVNPDGTVMLRAGISY